MRFSIFGYSQERMTELEIDVLDALILNWFAIFFAGKMVKQTFANQSGQEKIYGWVQISKVKDDLPSIGITTDRGIEKRFEKLVSKGILERITVQTAKGKRSYYATTDLYDSLLNTSQHESGAKPDIEKIDEKSQANSSSYGSEKTLFDDTQANSGSYGQANSGSYGSSQANSSSSQANSGSHGQTNSSSHALNRYMTSDIKTNDSLIIFPEKKNKDESFSDFLSDGQKEFGRIVHGILTDAGLPNGGSFITFLQRDFKLGLSTLHANGLGLHTGDIVQAVKNYAEVKRMSEAGKSSWNRFSPFNVFCKESIITSFLPGNFDSANFKRDDKAAAKKKPSGGILLNVI